MSQAATTTGDSRTASETITMEELRRRTREMKAAAAPQALFVSQEYFDAFKIDQVQPLDVTMREIADEYVHSKLYSYRGLPVYLMPKPLCVSGVVCGDTITPAPLEPITVTAPVWPSFFLAAVLAAVIAFLASV